MRSLSVSLIMLFSSPLAAEPQSGTGGAVASARPEATRAGVEMLAMGGNAADAAVATAFALAVAEPYASGIGGGGFATIKMGDEILFLDFREVAPLAATEDMFVKDGEPQADKARNGPLAVAVPGAVAGYLHLHEKYGRLSRRQVLAPAIRLAKKGVRVDARYRRRGGYRLDLMRQDPAMAQAYLVRDEAGQWQLPALDSVLKQPDLAKTLQAISRRGAEGFYSGKVADALVADMQRRGGLLTHEDLQRYQVRERQPLVGQFMGHTILTAPPPSSGGQIVLTILNMLEAKGVDEKAWNQADALHHYIEASKQAFADRALLGDPAFVVDVTPMLIKKDRAQDLVAGIGESARSPTDIVAGAGLTLPEELRPQALPKESPDTSHLSVVDRDGNAIALTATINFYFGACIVAQGTGMIWNDHMDDFAIGAGVDNAYAIAGSAVNAVAPSKIPLSSMSPTLVLSGPELTDPVRLVLGSPGGPRIPTTVAQAIRNVLVYDMAIDRAIEMGRLHHQHSPDVVFVEQFNLDTQTLDALRTKGHTLKVQGRWSEAMGIEIDPETGIRWATSDARGIGSALLE